MNYSKLTDAVKGVSSLKNRLHIETFLGQICSVLDLQSIQYWMISAYYMPDENDNFLYSSSPLIEKHHSNLKQTILQELNRQEITEFDKRAIPLSQPPAYLTDGLGGSDTQTDFEITPTFGPISHKGCFVIGRAQGFEANAIQNLFLISLLQSIHMQFAQLYQEEERPVHKITPREVDILKHLVNGLSNSEIAKQVSLSQFTVAGYLRSLGLKLSANNRVSVAIKAVTLGIIRL